MHNLCGFLFLHTQKKQFLCASFVPFFSLTLDQKSAPKCLMMFYSRAAVPYLTHKGNINHCRFKSLPVTHASTTLFLLFQKKSEKNKKKRHILLQHKGPILCSRRAWVIDRVLGGQLLDEELGLLCSEREQSGANSANKGNRHCCNLICVLWNVALILL